MRFPVSAEGIAWIDNLWIVVRPLRPVGPEHSEVASRETEGPSGRPELLHPLVRHPEGGRELPKPDERRFVDPKCELAAGAELGLGNCIDVVLAREEVDSRLLERGIPPPALQIVLRLADLTLDERVDRKAIADVERRPERQLVIRIWMSLVDPRGRGAFDLLPPTVIATHGVAIDLIRAVYVLGEDHLRGEERAHRVALLVSRRPSELQEAVEAKLLDPVPVRAPVEVDRPAERPRVDHAGVQGELDASVVDPSDVHELLSSEAGRGSDVAPHDRVLRGLVVVREVHGDTVIE